MSNPMKSNLVTVFVVGALVGVFAAGSVWLFLWETKGNSRDQVTQIFRAISIGDSMGDAAQVILRHARGLSFSSTESTNETKWYVSEPDDFFQRHWVLVVCTAKGKVTGKRIGTGDDVALKPKDAPDSIGECIPK